jgi:hypothetical protein
MLHTVGTHSHPYTIRILVALFLTPWPGCEQAAHCVCECVCVCRHALTPHEEPETHLAVSSLSGVRAGGPVHRSIRQDQRKGGSSEVCAHCVV